MHLATYISSSYQIRNYSIHYIRMQHHTGTYCTIGNANLDRHRICMWYDVTIHMAVLLLSQIDTLELHSLL